jgi:hypothetical protein
MKGNAARLWDLATAQPIGWTMSPVAGATLAADERTIVGWSDGALRWWDIGWPTGDLTEIACALLPDRDTSGLLGRYGVSVNEPICDPAARPPAPDWRLVERAPAP